MRNSRTITMIAILCWARLRQPGARRKTCVGDGGRSAPGQYEEAITHADQELARSPHGREAAEALYLRGRAFEARIEAR